MVATDGPQKQNRLADQPAFSGPRFTTELSGLSRDEAQNNKACMKRVVARDGPPNQNRPADQSGLFRTALYHCATWPQLSCISCAAGSQRIKCAGKRVVARDGPKKENCPADQPGHFRAALYHGAIWPRLSCISARREANKSNVLEKEWWPETGPKTKIAPPTSPAFSGPRSITALPGLS